MATATAAAKAPTPDGTNAEAPAAVKAEAPKKQPVIGRAAYQLAEFQTSVWLIMLPDGVTKDTLLDGPLWLMAPEGIQPFDIFRVVSENWWAEILIRQCIRGRPLQLVLLRMVDLPEIMEDRSDRMPPGYTIERTPQHGWTIVRLADGVRMLSGLEHGNIHSREAALRWLLDHASLRQSVRQ